MSRPATLAERFDGLVRAYDGQPDELELLADRANRIQDYIEYVAWLDRNIPVWRVQYPVDQCMSKVYDGEITRKSKHDACIQAVRGLNVMAAAKQLPPIHTGDIADRDQYALFAADFTQAYIDRGLGRGGRAKTTAVQQFLLERQTAAPDDVQREAE